MRNLNDTIARLTALRGTHAAGAHGGAVDRLSDLADFGSNPGALRARCYVPEGLADTAPLVVVLHGCTQNAAGYDHGSGWSRLADEHGFALLFPEQSRANNANLCFNWFNPDDIRRGSGESLSIRQMVAAMVKRYGIDPARIFVTGLSAGGAMTSVMLATYPEVFAGGAIIAGLPYGTARSIPDAFDRMRAHGGPRGAALGRLVSAASGHRGPWPTISVWHGTSDMTVSHLNAALIVEQWRAIHGATPVPNRIEDVAGHKRTVWTDADGRDAIEEISIQGLGHGTPLSTTGQGSCGAAGPFMLEAGISSTHRIAAFWGLTEQRAVHKAVASSAEATVKTDTARPPSGENRIQRVIEDALRAAGLMR